MNAWTVWYWSANEAERHFDSRPSRYCKSSQTSSRTWMLSEKVLPLTCKLIRERLSKSTAAIGFLPSTYSTTPSGVMTSNGSGSAHFRPREDAGPGEVELGYRLRKSAWGKGYATEGSRALINRGFTEFGVQRVVAETMAVNMASRRVMEKAGLKLVRTFHQPWPHPIEGDQFGDVEYALDKAGWQRDQVSTAPR